MVALNLRENKKEVILGPLFKLAEAVLELFVPLVVAKIINNGIGNADKNYIIRTGLLLPLIAALGIVAAMICQYYAAVAAGNFGRKLRAQLCSHVLSLSDSETAKYGAGGLITRLTNDANQIQNGVNMAIRLASRVPFLTIGSVVMALILNWRIGLIFLVSTPMIALVLYWIMKITVPGYGRIQEHQDQLSRLGGENLEGMRVIRAFSRRQQEEREFFQAGDQLTAAMTRVGKLSAILNPATSLIVNMSIIAIVWLGSKYAFNGLSDKGEIVALVSYMNQMLLAMIAAANLIVIFTRAVASLRRVAEVLEIRPGIVDGPGAQEDPSAPLIEFKNVCFAYHEGAGNALDDISFQVEKGQTIGVIGGTGSGKSTVVNLLMRYYDVGSGQICIKGADVRDYPLGELRGKLGLVPQTAALFTGSIRRNLTLGAPGVYDESLWRALKIAQGSEFVEKLPEKLDTFIEEGGKNLSGGQRQRLTIARALAREPEILILDDSSSALDYATDAALRRSLRADTEGMTVLIISQRASALKHADLILALDDGKIAGAGTHDQLLESCGLYREICESQGLVEKRAG